jgi:uncharacterized protein
MTPMNRKRGFLMKMASTQWAVVLFLSLILGGCNPDSMSISVGTGSEMGIYYQVGHSFKTFLEKMGSKKLFDIQILPTAGSVQNIKELGEGKLNFGIAQSDIVYNAVYGKAGWRELGPQEDLRTVLSLHYEAVTLVAIASNQLSCVKNLEGKRVNLGRNGSGQLKNAREILRAFKLGENNLRSSYYPIIEAVDLIDQDYLEAFFYTVGHPNRLLQQAEKGQVKLQIMNITGPEVDALIQKRPYYFKTRIPRKFYKNMAGDYDTQTIGVQAVLLTSVETSDIQVYHLVKEIIENLNKLKEMSPALTHLDVRRMVTKQPAPFHDGALRYFKEKGLLNVGAKK